MTLGQFAVAVGAPPRWVLNALTRLKVARRYSEPLARRLALAKMLSDSAGTALPEAWALAQRALAETDPFGTWRHESPNGAIALVVEMPRFFTSYGVRLSLARSNYGEKARGPKARRKGTAVERARAYGVDTTLLESALHRTPEQRMSMLAENMDFVRALRERPR